MKRTFYIQKTSSKTDVETILRHIEENDESASITLFAINEIAYLYLHNHEWPKKGENVKYLFRVEAFSKKEAHDLLSTVVQDEPAFSIIEPGIIARE